VYPQVLRGGPSVDLMPGPAAPGRAADMARHQMRVGIPESMKSQHVRQYAPRSGSLAGARRQWLRCVSASNPVIRSWCGSVHRPGPPHRFLNDALGDNWQLLVLVLAQGAQPIQCFGFGSAAPAHHDADCALDHPTTAQGGLQLTGEPLGLSEDLGVLHGDGRRHCEEFPEAPGIWREGVLDMGVHVHRAKHTLVGDQRQGYDAVYAKACCA
jgi:hypothetical protein